MPRPNKRAQAARIRAARERRTPAEAPQPSGATARPARHLTSARAAESDLGVRAAARGAPNPWARPRAARAAARRPKETRRRRRPSGNAGRSRTPLDLHYILVGGDGGTAARARRASSRKSTRRPSASCDCSSSNGSKITCSWNKNLFGTRRSSSPTRRRTRKKGTRWRTSAGVPWPWGRSRR